MSDVDLAVAIDLDTNSAVIRDKIDDLLYNLMNQKYIDPVEMLQAGSFIGSERARRMLERKKEEQQAMAAQQQQMMGGSGGAAGYMPMQQAPQTTGAPTVPEAADHLKNEQPTGV